MPSVSRPFIDKLLLSIIEPQLEKRLSRLARQQEREKRLHAAKTALFGERRRTIGYDDSAALLFMAEQYVRDRYVDLSTGSRVRREKPRSIRRLVNEAARFAFGNSEASTAQRLRTLFRNKTLQKYVDIVRYGDDVDASIEERALQQISETLRTYGIAMDLTAARLGRPGSKKSAKGRSSILGK